jgi:hypothetical protein
MVSLLLGGLPAQLPLGADIHKQRASIAAGWISLLIFRTRGTIMLW